MLPCTVSILSLKMERNRFVRTPETSDNPKTRTETENWPLLAGRGLPHKLCRSVRRFFRVNPAHLGRLCGPNSSPPNLWRLGRLARWAFSASSWIGPAAKFISRHGARQSPLGCFFTGAFGTPGSGSGSGLDPQRKPTWEQV